MGIDVPNQAGEADFNSLRAVSDCICVRLIALFNDKLTYNRLLHTKIVIKYHSDLYHLERRKLRRIYINHLY